MINPSATVAHRNATNEHAGHPPLFTALAAVVGRSEHPPLCASPHGCVPALAVALTVTAFFFDIFNELLVFIDALVCRGELAAKPVVLDFEVIDPLSEVFILVSRITESDPLAAQNQFQRVRGRSGLSSDPDPHGRQ